MRNLLWTTLRNSGALLACSVLQCNSRHGSDDNNVRSQHMGQVTVTLSSYNHVFSV